MGSDEMKLLAAWMGEVADNQDDATTSRISAQVKELCAKFPPPGIAVE